jgi:hypothetical protein
MRNFIQSIEVGGQHVNFLFPQVLTKEVNKYFATAMNSNGLAASCEIKESHPWSWMVLRPAPQWVLPLQSELGQTFNTKNSAPQAVRTLHASPPEPLQQ